MRLRRLPLPVSLSNAELALGVAAFAAICLHAYAMPSFYADSWAPTAVARDVAHGANQHAIYKKVFFELEIKFQYPPIFLLYFETLSDFGIATLRRFHALNFCLFVANGVATGVLASHVFKGLYPARQRLIALLAFCGALLYGPIVTAHYIGQVQVLINLLFTLSCLAILRGRQGLAGGLLAVTCSIKPQFVLHLFSNCSARNWSFCAAFCGCGAILGIISLYAYGWTNHVDYLSVLRHLSQHGESHFWNNSINGILNGIIGNGSTSDVLLVNGVYQTQLPPFHPVVYWTSLAAFVGFSALPVMMGFRTKRHSRRSLLLLFLLSAACSVVASPIAWVHHFGVLLPAQLILLGCLLEMPASAQRRTRLYLTAASVVLSAMYVPHLTSANGPIVLIHAPNFIGACIFIFVVAGQLRQIRANDHEGITA